MRGEVNFEKNISMIVMFSRDLEIDVIPFKNQRQNIQIIDDVFYNNVMS